LSGGGSGAPLEQLPAIIIINTKPAAVSKRRKDRGERLRVPNSVENPNKAGSNKNAGGMPSPIFETAPSVEAEEEVVVIVKVAEAEFRPGVTVEGNIDADV
jgi:hypothetical protein